MKQIRNQMVGAVVLFQVFLVALAASGQTNANLVRNGDFEQGENGYPLEWSFRGANGKSLSEAEYNEKYSYEMTGGKDGDRCMLIKGGGYFRQDIRTPVAKGDKYKISAYVKTEKMAGKIHLDVIPGKGWIKYWCETAIEKPTQDWTLTEKIFTPTENDNGFGVLIRSGLKDGKAWIDGVKLELVEKGRTQTNAPSAAIEQQKKIRIDSFYPLGERGLFEEKEPLRFQISVINTTAEQQEFEVSFVIKDFSDALVRESRTNLIAAANAGCSQTIDLGAIPDKYGFFCVRASVRQKDAVIDQEATGCCILRPADTEKDSFLDANYNGPYDRFLINAMQRIGVASRGVDFCLSWVSESLRTNFDAFVSHQITNRFYAFWNSDLELIGAILEDSNRGFGKFGPKWYAAEMKARYDRGEFPDPDEYWQEYGDFVEVVARQAHKRIKVWEIAEEIDGTVSVCRDRRDENWALERYIRRVKIANERLKKVDPDCTVIALGASCSELTPPYWSMTREKLLPALKGHFDMAGPDAYCDIGWLFTRDNIERAGPEKQNLRAALLATADLQKSLGSKTDKFAICEKGWSVPYNYEPDDEVTRKVAPLVARYLVLARSVTNLAHVSIFCISSAAGLNAYINRNKPDWIDGTGDMGLWKVVYKNPANFYFYPKSWAAAVATFQRLLANATNPMELNVRKGFYAYAFQKKEQAITAFWTIEKRPFQMMLNLPVKSEYCDLMGNTRELPEGRNELTVSECPFFLITKASVNEVSNMVSRADFPAKGLLDAEAHVDNLSALTVYLQNKTSRPVKAEVTLDPIAPVNLPDLKKEAVVPPRGRTAVNFEMKGADFSKLNNMKITGKVRAENREIPISENVDLIPVREIKKPATIDADLSKYAACKPILLGENNLMTLPEYAANNKDLWKNNDNLSAGFYLAWDTNNFYIAAEVIDDALMQRQAGVNIWMDDCVQFAFDTKNDAMKAGDVEKAEYDENDYNFGMALTTNGPVCWCWFEKGRWTKKYEGAKKFPLAIKREGTKTIYELAIPWKNLAPLEPRPGRVFRFSFIVFDNDSESQAQAKYWLGLTSGIAGGVDPSAYRTFVLMPAD